MPTSIPFLARSRAVALPMPDVAPVTSARSGKMCIKRGWPLLEKYSGRHGYDRFVSDPSAALGVIDFRKVVNGPSSAGIYGGAEGSGVIASRLKVLKTRSPNGITIL